MKIIFISILKQNKNKSFQKMIYERKMRKSIDTNHVDVQNKFY